ncbi:unnamed protein product, partial [Allacma fusca]
MGRSASLEDYSTFRGKLLLVLSRINVLWILPAFGFLLLLALLVLSSRSAPSGVPENVPTSRLRSSASSKNASLKDGHYVFEGSQDELFPGLDASLNKSDLVHLEIRGAVIDINVLADCLDGASNLRTIHIVAQELTRSMGQRVHLPKLEQFHFTYTPRINADEFKKAEILKDIMFFNKLENKDWDFRSDVLNLGIHIVIVIDGTTLLEVNRKTGLININLHFCSEILSNVAGEFTSLTLSWCSLTNVSLVSPSLKYLNLNNAIPRSPRTLST